jgi:hypothetical protein
MTNSRGNSKYSCGECWSCGKHHEFLMALHADNGGPMCCLVCSGKWHAEHGRRRKLGRIVIRAIMAFLDGGGRYQDIDKLSVAATAHEYFGLDPLGYRARRSRFAGAFLASNKRGDNRRVDVLDRQTGTYFLFSAEGRLYLYGTWPKEMLAHLLEL